MVSYVIRICIHRFIFLGSDGVILMEDIKQYILINSDLNMSIGKKVAAGAHASLGVFFDICELADSPLLVSEDPIFPTDYTPYYEYKFRVITDVHKWIKGSFVKICLSAQTLQMAEIVELASNSKVLYKVIQDNGTTEVDPGSVTAVAIGPLDITSASYKKLAGKLKSLPLLK
jgi:peptidyl-tRNA hydrolase